MPALGAPGRIEGENGAAYAFYLSDFSSEEDRGRLKEWVSIEFDPDPGEVSRALNCTVVFREEATPAAAPPPEAKPALSPVPEPVVVTYQVPSPSPVACKAESPAGWEVIVVSNWLVRGSSLAGPDEARRNMLKRAHALNANALLSMEYSRTEIPAKFRKPEEPAYLHHCQGRLAVIGKKDPAGKLMREDLFIDLDEEAERAASRLEQDSAAARQTNYVIYAGCLAALVATAMAADYAIAPMLLVGSVAAVAATRLTRDTSVDHYLIHQPPEATALARWPGGAIKAASTGSPTRTARP